MGAVPETLQWPLGRRPLPPAPLSCCPFEWENPTAAKVTMPCQRDDETRRCRLGCGRRKRCPAPTRSVMTTPAAAGRAQRLERV